jgi:crotonobetainyl-CoA:carnitine CoA-transferase CaiB-like acyl-CoA transferase
MFEKLKILELSNVLAGPAVGMFFAELGAKVLKIENVLSNGDITRKWKLPNEKKESISAYFSAVNFNKDYLLMNFNNPDQKKQIEDFIKTFDIVITNFKDGDAEKFDLTFNDCKKINPKIIYAHIGGFKSDPERVAFDVILQAENGYISMTGNKNQYAKMPVAMIDVLAAHQIKEGILIALMKQQHDNKAYKVSTTLEESAIASLMNQSSNYLMANHESSPIGTLHPNIAPYGDTISTADNLTLILAIGTDKQFEKFCQIIKLDEKIKSKFNSNSKRLKNREELMNLIKQRTAVIKAEFILKKCKENYVPIGKIKKVGEVLESDLGKEMVLKEKINGQLTKRIKTISFHLSN